MHTTQEIMVEITQLVYGGDGMGRLASGQVVFVPFTAPGDKANITLTTQRKSVGFGQIKTLVMPSLQRQEPPCSVFGRCGGCHWQHLDLATQRHWKQHIVAESLRRIGGLTDMHVSPIIGEGDGWYYRNKAEWHVVAEAGQYRLGYLAAKSHTVVPFEKCWIIPGRMDALAHWLTVEQALIAGAEKIQVRTSTVGNWLLTFYGRDIPAVQEADRLSALVHAFPEIHGIGMVAEGQYTCLWGQSTLIETLDDKTYEISAESFFQIHPAMTRKLLAFLETRLPSQISCLLDLYAGVGLFAVWFAHRAQQIIAVESSPAAVRDGQANVARNGLTNVTYTCQSDHQALADLPEDIRAVILDPPRSGCHPQVLRWLSQSAVKQLVYVSCNPTTLARDLKQLCAEGWQIEAIQPFDFFPQTYHVETVAVLKHNPPN